MANELEIRRGDVWWIRDRDSLGREEAMRRPYLVVSSDKGNETANVIICAALTTKTKYGSINVKLESLDRPSWVMCNQVFTFDKQRVDTYICSLSDEEVADVDRALCIAMSLFPEPNEEYEEKLREYEEEISSMKTRIADLMNQLSQQKVRKTVDEKLYERAIEEIVSLRLAADINRVIAEKATVVEKESDPEPKVVEEPTVVEEAKPDINTCTQSDLRQAGCNNTMVHNIIANRPYTSVDGLKTVPGITRIAYQILEKKLTCVPVKKEPKKETVAVRKVNVNTATVDEMEAVAGMNRTLCNFIRAYRNKNGPFKTVEDLLNVPRFGAGCMKKYGPMLEV